MSYGRHQSFYLKRHWITKGLNSYILFGENTIFEKDSFVLLGLGKNMHQSLRYWLESTNIMRLENKSHKLTKFGLLVKNYDIGCDLNLTKNLLHYFLVNEDENLQKSETFYWFFNKYKENIFSKEKLINDIVLWNSNATSANTLRRDIDCLISLYTKDKMDHPEDKNISILANMKLIKLEGSQYVKSSIDRSSLSLKAIFFLLLRFKENNIPLSLSNIMNLEGSVGRAFNLNRTELIDCIEELMSKGVPIEITRTNNLDTVIIKEEINSYSFLESAYKGELEW